MASSEHDTRDGIILGLIAYASVAAFYAIFDRMAVFMYNGVHLALSLAIGLIVVRLVSRAERDRAQASPMFLLIVAGFVVTVIGVGVLSEPIRVVLPWWSIVVANASAVVFGALYLTSRRPGVIGRVVPLAA